MRYILLFIFSFLSPLPRQLPQFVRAYHLNGYAQGTTYHITYYATDSLVAVHDADSILLALDSSLSVYQPWSLVSRFNNDSQEIRMDQHLEAVIRRSLEIAADSKGIFDPTVYPLVQAWGFGPFTTDSLPSPSQVERVQQCVSYHYLQLKGNILYKTRPCVKLDLNGIAQGYSVDVLAGFLEQRGIYDYLVELGGEIRVKGKRRPDNHSITIGIEAPPANEFEAETVQRIISIDHGAITTSGSYRHYRESKGHRLSHIIDPRTGYPSVNELVSVTVYAPDAITADGYDNTLMVMGLSDALAFVEVKKDLAAYFIYRKNDGRLADTASQQFYGLINK